MAVIQTQVVDLMTSHALLDLPTSHVGIHQQVGHRMQKGGPAPVDDHHSLADILQGGPEPGHFLRIEPGFDGQPGQVAEDPVVRYVGVDHLRDPLLRPHGVIR